MSHDNNNWWVWIEKGSVQFMVAKSSKDAAKRYIELFGPLQFGSKICVTDANPVDIFTLSLQREETSR